MLSFSYISACISHQLLSLWLCANARVLEVLRFFPPMPYRWKCCLLWLCIQRSFPNIRSYWRKVENQFFKGLTAIRTVHRANNHQIMERHLHITDKDLCCNLFSHVCTEHIFDLMAQFRKLMWYNVRLDR